MQLIEEVTLAFKTSKRTRLIVFFLTLVLQFRAHLKGNPNPPCLYYLFVRLLALSVAKKGLTWFSIDNRA